MEILYLWIENHNDFIINQGFSFSSQFIFNYDLDSKRINYKANPLFIDNFFRCHEKINIVNINAIIGSNGVGKTTILDLIKKNLCTGEGGISNHLIVIFREYSDKIIRIRYSKKIEISNLLELTKIYDTKFFEITNTSNGNISDFDNTSFITYSNIFDGRREFSTEFLNTNLLNISTNNLLYKDYFDYRNPNYKFKTSSENKLERINGSNPLIVHKNYETKRQLFYKQDKHGSLCDIEIPNQINVLIREINIKSIFPEYPGSESDSEFDTNYLLHKLNTLRERLGDFYIYTEMTEMNFEKYRNSIISSYEYAGYVMSKSIYFDFINNASNMNYMFSIKQLSNLEFNIKENVLNDLKLFFNKILNDINNDKSIFTQDSPKQKIEIYIKYILKFISTFDNFLKSIDTKNIKEYKSYASILLNNVKDQVDMLNNLIKSYLNISPSLDLIDFEWPGLSSGEKAKLNFFSRFYELINNKVNKFSTLKKNIILLIDEGELYYHPQWQKCFISDLIKYLPVIWSSSMHDQINLQIILTSNSPFLISDLPKINVTFLKRKSNRELENVHLEDQKQTFASNIHSLFTDSFFVEHGLIGEFAKSKIDYVINILQNDKISNLDEKEKTKIQNIIEIIGEPVIRNKLLNMLEDQLKITLLGSEKRIKDLEKKVANLEKGN